MSDKKQKGYKFHSKDATSFVTHANQCGPDAVTYTIISPLQKDQRQTLILQIIGAVEVFLGTRNDVAAPDAVGILGETPVLTEFVAPSGGGAKRPAPPPVDAPAAKVGKSSVKGAVKKSVVPPQSVESPSPSELARDKFCGGLVDAVEHIIAGEILEEGVAERAAAEQIGSASPKASAVMASPISPPSPGARSAPIVVSSAAEEEETPLAESPGPLGGSPGSCSSGDQALE